MHINLKSWTLKSVMVITAAFFATAAFGDWSHYTGAKGQRQDTDNWCWAATSRLIVKHNKGRSPVQCKLASRWIAKRDYGTYCCTGGTNEWGRQIPSGSRAGSCDKGFHTKTVLAHYGAFERYVSHPNDPAGRSGVQRQLSQNTPPVVIMLWATGGKHAISIVSGKFRNGTTRYELYNPTGGREWISRSNMKVYKGGKWIATIHTK